LLINLIRLAITTAAATITIFIIAILHPNPMLDHFNQPRVIPLGKDLLPVMQKLAFLLATFSTGF